MKTWLLVLCCFLACVCSACSANRETYGASRGGGTQTIREFTDPARAISVRAGETFVITLDSNATTGYSWQAPERTSCVSLSSHRYEAPGSSLAGAPGKEHFEFTARSPGKENLLFRYLRPWENNVPPAQTATFAIEVIKRP